MPSSKNRKPKWWEDPPDHSDERWRWGLRPTDRWARETGPEEVEDDED